jgi:hypothetical protein
LMMNHRLIRRTRLQIVESDQIHALHLGIPPVPRVTVCEQPAKIRNSNSSNIFAMILFSS